MYSAEVFKIRSMLINFKAVIKTPHRLYLWTWFANDNTQDICEVTRCGYATTGNPDTEGRLVLERTNFSYGKQN
jgi:hypothetical protein